MEKEFYEHMTYVQSADMHIRASIWKMLLNGTLSFLGFSEELERNNKDTLRVVSDYRDKYNNITQ